MIKSAKNCVERSQQNSKFFEELPEEVALTKGLSSEEKRFLQGKKTSFQKQDYQCRLFILQAEDTLLSLRKTIKTLSAKTLLSKSGTIFDNLKSSMSAPSINFKTQQFLKESGAIKFQTRHIIILVLFLLLTLAVSVQLRKKLKSLTKKFSQTQTLWRSFLRSLARYLLLILISFNAFIFTFFLFGHEKPWPRILEFSYVLVFYLLALCLLRTLRNRGKEAFDHEKNSPLSIFALRSRLLAGLLFAGKFYEILLYDFLNLIGFFDLIISLYFVSIAFALALIVWPESSSKENASAVDGARKFCSFFLFSSLTVLELSGYHELAWYFYYGLISSLFIIIFSSVLWFILDHALASIDDRKSAISVALRKKLILKPHHQLVEIMLVRIALTIVFFTAAIIILFDIWEFELFYGNYLFEAALQGFELGNIKISPLRIVMALNIFTLISLGIRWSSASITRHYQKTGETEQQVAFASIVNYVGISLALFISLLIAGADFTGIAIIVGALSVGIGLGLQDIVNNFISGVILLIEKPIKPGDRVRVGTTEGFVTKIRIRSTQISTMAREDVIVPNKELISSQVTNFMFRDNLWRISCRVGVAYGSDIELVKKVLFQVAHEDERFLKEKPNEPVVLFREFGDSALIFELWCVIKNVNNKFIIISETNFKIDHRFRENKITIAFPQLDIHLHHPKSAKMKETAV